MNFSKIFKVSFLIKFSYLSFLCTWSITVLAHNYSKVGNFILKRILYFFFNNAKFLRHYGNISIYCLKKCIFLNLKKMGRRHKGFYKRGAQYPLNYSLKIELNIKHSKIFPQRIFVIKFTNGKILSWIFFPIKLYFKNSKSETHFFSKIFHINFKRIYYCNTLILFLIGNSSFYITGN